MNDKEINQAVCTQVLKWEHVEGSVYKDIEGAYVYAADYCNSVAHALDLAMTYKISLTPLESGWQAQFTTNPSVIKTDSLPGRAICLCLLPSSFDIPVSNLNTGAVENPVGEAAISN